MGKVISAKEVAQLLTEQGYEANYDSELKTILVPSQELTIGPANESDGLDYDLISYGISIDLDEDEENDYQMARIYDEAEGGEFTASNLVRDIIEYMESN